MTVGGCCGRSRSCCRTNRSYHLQSSKNEIKVGCCSQKAIIIVASSFFLLAMISIGGLFAPSYLKDKQIGKIVQWSSGGTLFIGIFTALGLLMCLDSKEREIRAANGEEMDDYDSGGDIDPF